MASRFGGLLKLGTTPAGGMPAGPFKSASSSTGGCSGAEEAFGFPIDAEIQACGSRDGDGGIVEDSWFTGTKRGAILPSYVQGMASIYKPAVKDALCVWKPCDPCSECRRGVFATYSQNTASLTCFKEDLCEVNPPFCRIVLEYELRSACSYTCIEKTIRSLTYQNIRWIHFL